MGRRSGRGTATVVALWAAAVRTVRAVDGESPPAVVLLAGIAPGAVSAALAGCVSRTFVKSQEADAGHPRACFGQPAAFSRSLAAERLLRDGNLDEAKRAEVPAADRKAPADDPLAPPSA